MSRQLAHFVHAVFFAVFLAVAMPAFAQPKAPPFIGTTRDQVVGRLGDPKSNLKAGTRELLFYPHLKLTLRNGIVVETEEIADEPAPRHVPEAAPAAGAASNTATSGAGSTSTTSPAPANPESANAPTVKPTPEVSALPVKPAPPPEPQLEIKSIRSGSPSARSAVRPAAKTATEPVTPPPVTPALPPVAAADSKPAVSPPAATPPVVAAARTDAKAEEEKDVAAAKPETEPLAATEEAAAPEVAPEKPAVDPKKKAEVQRRRQQRRDAEADEEPVQLFSTQSYVIAGITMVAGVWYLWWRRAQRKLELAATSVSHTPFEPAATADTAEHFTTELIGKLGAPRFERLVASYYAKTGVVAERTNAAPGSPVQIKIFWKGEPKPFAGVQCHANSPTLIDAKPLQDLFAALSAAEIRRGYIVTTGKFNVEARDYAEEKHFTLLSGDLFLEKLNALPPAARAELLKETATDEPAAPPPPSAIVT